MSLEKTRKYHSFLRLFTGFLTKNPVTVSGLALPFVIAASFSVKSAVCIIISLSAVTIPMILLTSLGGRYLPAFVRIPLYTLFSCILLIFVQKWLNSLFPTVVDALGLYIPVIAVNTLTLFYCEKYAVHEKVFKAIWRGILALLGFSFTIFIVSVLREILGNGTFWNVPITFLPFNFSGILIPFGGCIVLSFVSAGGRYLGRAIRKGIYYQDQKSGKMPLKKEVFTEEYPDEPLILPRSNDFTSDQNNTKRERLDK